MPSVYLSPSLQEYNPYIDGGNEEYYMNLIADAMEPYLRASGIDFQAKRSRYDAESGNCRFKQGQSRFAPCNSQQCRSRGSAGKYTGADIYYYPTSSNGKRFAEILQKNYKDIYPEPNDVDIIPTTSLAEVRRTKSPSALIEVAYHDNPEEAQWIRDNINAIGRNLAKSVAEYLICRLSSRNLILTKNKGQHDYVLTFCYSSKYAFKNNQIFRSYCSFHYISIRCSQHLKHIFLLILTVCPTAKFQFVFIQLQYHSFQYCPRLFARCFGIYRVFFF